MTEAEMIQCAIDEGFAAEAIVDTAQNYARPLGYAVVAKSETPAV